MVNFIYVIIFHINMKYSFIYRPVWFTITLLVLATIGVFILYMIAKKISLRGIEESDQSIFKIQLYN